MLRPAGFCSPKPEIYNEDIMGAELESDTPDVWRIDLGR
jgi:hypothetical protein